MRPCHPGAGRGPEKITTENAEINRDFRAVGLCFALFVSVVKIWIPAFAGMTKGTADQTIRHPGTGRGPDQKKNSRDSCPLASKDKQAQAALRLRDLISRNRTRRLLNRKDAKRSERGASAVLKFVLEENEFKK